MKTFHKIALLLMVAVGFRLHAEPGGLVKFSGAAVDAKGNPVAGASVDCYHFPTRMFSVFPDTEAKQHATTDEKGAFAFSIPDGAMCVVVKKAGLGSAWKTWQSAPTGAVEQLVLAAPSTLAGVVLDEKDRPIAGAEVRVSAAVDTKDGDWTMRPNYVFGEAAGDLFSARTSADGRFRIADFPAGAQANLTVTIPGRALRVANASRGGMQLQAQAGQEDIKLITDPAAGIEGVIVLRDTGAPVAHAKIQVQPINPMGGFGAPPHTVQSGADGSFRVSELPAGSYHVTAVFTDEPVPSLVSESVPVTVAVGETARDVKIQAFKGGVVEVTVVGKSDQKTLANVGVSAYSEGVSVGSTTDTGGIAWLRLPPGSFSLFAMKEGMSQAQSQATVVDGQTNRVKLELSLPLQVSGTVRDASGAPVANTAVALYPNFTGEPSDVRTDATGHFNVKWQPPAWNGMQDQRYYLVARNAERKLAAVQEVQLSTTTMDVELKDGISVSGRVQDDKGKAITNATAFLMVRMEHTGFSINRQPIRADDQGRIRFEGLPPGPHYSLNVSANGYGTSEQTVPTADPKANHYEFPPVVLKLADHKLTGRVLGTNGQPVAAVQVWMHGDGQPNNNSMTDANGRFAFESVCSGPVSVSVNSKGLSGAVDAMGGDTNVVIRIGNNRFYGQVPPLTISGTVYDSSGNPAAGVQVGVTPSWGPVDSATTDGNGEYSVHWQDQQGMRGAKYFVVARDTDRNLAALEEIDAKKTHASLRLEPGFSITGTVQDTEGKPLTSANVNLNMMAGNMGGMVSREPVRVESDGTFTIAALPKGQAYHVYISASGCGSAQRPIGKTQSQSNSVQLPPFRLKTADRDLAGEVLGMDGKPLPGVSVYTYGNNQPNVNARTDADGHFQFKVCAGPINVNAYLPQGGRNNFGTTEARGGDTKVVVKIGAPQRRQPMIRALSVKPQPWTLGAIIAWPAGHKTVAIILLAVQTTVLLGTGAGIFWMTRKRKSQ